MPKLNLPQTRFRHPEDARTQVAMGIDYFTEDIRIRSGGHVAFRRVDQQ